MGLEGVVTASTQTGSVSMRQGLNSMLSSHSTSAFAPSASQVGHVNGTDTMSILMKSTSYQRSKPKGSIKLGTHMLRVHEAGHVAATVFPV